MIIIRPAQQVDFQAIESILDELDLGHQSISMDRFWVAVDGGEVVGVSNIEDCGASCYLSAVGVRTSHQGRGIASRLLNQILEEAHKVVYIYTKIPDYFRRFGFSNSQPSQEIPPREIYDCESCCGSDECVCMVRYPDVCQRH